jgi:c-di-GMP-binding flagellar brake protein YcgR
LGILPVLGILMLVLYRPKKKSGPAKASWWKFRSQGRAARFSSAEISLLKKVVQQSETPNPVSLFQSPELVDLCIRSLFQATRNNDPARQDLIAKLYEFRKKLDARGPKRGLTTSRGIEAGQNLRVVAANAAIYQCRVIRNTPQYLLATRPVNANLRSAPAWQGQRVSIYFWKEEDAGYVFDGQVLDEVFVKGVSAIQISHSDSLLRTQKRRSLRIKTHKLTYLYLLNDAVSSDTPETTPGLKCFMEDMSDTGCSVTIGGRASKGIRVKLQFELDKKPFVMCGEVRSVEYNEATNRSLLHVEADSLSQEAKSAIFAEMFSATPAR